MMELRIENQMMEKEVELKTQGNRNLEIEEQILHIAKGDKEAMRQLYALTSQSVYAYALSILNRPVDAEDVMHDCYLAVFRAANQYQPNGKPLAWILTITRNLAYAKIKKEKQYTDPDIMEYQVLEDSHLSTVEKATLELCMNQLSQEEREIVILHVVAGFKHREIARQLQVPLSTVLNKYNRAIKKVKTEYEKGEKIHGE